MNRDELITSASQSLNQEVVNYLYGRDYGGEVAIVRQMEAAIKTLGMGQINQAIVDLIDRLAGRAQDAHVKYLEPVPGVDERDRVSMCNANKKTADKFRALSQELQKDSLVVPTSQV